MKPFDEYIFLAPGSDYGTVMWSDLKSVPNCTYHDYVLNEQCPPLLHRLHHLHFSFFLNRFMTLPFQYVWKKGYSVKIEDLSDNKKYCVIFTDISACRVDVKYLQELQSKANVELVLVLVNIVLSKRRLLEERFKYFSTFFSFDKADCDRYGFIHHASFYSKLPIDTSGKKDSDVFFVGVSKGMRHEKLAKIYNRLKKNNLVPNFYLAHHKNVSDRVDGIHYNEWLSYKEVLNKVSHTNCILEIVGDNQEGMTLRSMEAICYNKRLITDNLAITRLKYFESGFIQYLPQIENVDISFLKDTTPVDYQYENDFSPIKLLEHIEEVFSMMVDKQ